MKRKKINISENTIKQKDIRKFHGAFICNSVTGIQFVKKIDKHALSHSRELELSWINLSMSKFIVVEGSEGVGKSTQIKTIKSFLEEHKIEYIVTREPGGTSFGESIRSIILDQKNDTDNLTDSLLFYASRYENYNKVILPALKSGKTVICDRFHYSTLYIRG